MSKKTDNQIDDLMDTFYKIKLKPCPFCGEEPLFIANQNRIVCRSEGDGCIAPTTGYYGRWSDLLKEWNRRVKP